MIPGSMSHGSSHETPPPGNDPLHNAPGSAGRRLTEELQEVRKRALEALEELAARPSRVTRGALSDDVRKLVGITEEIEDDDLGLKAKIETCSEMRSSLFRQWAAVRGTPSHSDVKELIEINEAIDRSLMRSIARAEVSARKMREMFLAVLGHDLRTPLGAVVMASEYLVARGELAERDRRLADRIRSSSHRMTALVNDLLDFTRCRLGEGIPLTPSQTSLGAIAREVVEEVRASRPECDLRFEAGGELQGRWDAGRLWQALSNLIENAVLHGDGAPVTVTAVGTEDEVIASVHNAGSTISEDDQQRIFDPFEHCATDERPTEGLGLGLYIAREIVQAHGGRITLSSSVESGTTFEVHLPREA
jgi:signal transduction histidine kinase